MRSKKIRSERETKRWGLSDITDLAMKSALIAAVPKWLQATQHDTLYPKDFEDVQEVSL